MTQLTRRQVLTGAALAAAVGATNGIGRNLSALASVTVGPNGQKTDADALVVLFLRGGADGLNVVVPHAEDAYYKARPYLALARPKDARSAVTGRALDLDGFFGLHPALEPLIPLYKEGKMAAVHAIGSQDKTRSHFEAMATMERGLAENAGAASGWLARHLVSTAGELDSPLRAVSVTETTPDALRGASNAVALRSLADYRLIPPTDPEGRNFHPEQFRTAALEESLRGIYGVDSKVPGNADSNLIESAGKETLKAMEAIKRLDPANYKPGPGVAYDKSDVSHAFQQVACLLKGDVGMEVAFLDMGGWDTHYGQGRDSGLQPSLLGDLGRALAAFAKDLGPKLDNTTILVMTEFGRRSYENRSLGTDHGRASCMFLLGGGIAGGKVYADWPGLEEKQLDEGDLRVTTDYRDILAEILVRRIKNPKIAEVFPNYTPRFRNVTHA